MPDRLQLKRTMRIAALSLGWLAALLAAEAEAQSLTVHAIDQEGVPAPGVIVSLYHAGAISDTTDTNGTAYFDFGISSTPEDTPQMQRTSWGALKAGYRDGTFSGKPKRAEQELVNPDTLYFDGTSASAEPHYWSAKTAYTLSGGADVVHAAFPKYTITIPNGWDGANLTGPTQVGIIPAELRDVWDLIGDPDGYQYPQFTGWNPTDFPIQTVNYNCTSAEWTAAKTTMNNWESMTGFNFYDIQETYPPTNAKWMKYVHASPSVNNGDLDSDGFFGFFNH